MKRSKTMQTEIEILKIMVTDSLASTGTNQRMPVHKSRRSSTTTLTRRMRISLSTITANSTSRQHHVLCHIGTTFNEGTITNNKLQRDNWIEL